MTDNICPLQHSLPSDTFTSVDNRLMVVEKEVSGIKVGLIGIQDQLSALSNTINSMANASKTNWSTLAAWATVIMATVLYHSSIVLEPVKILINKQETDLSKLTSWHHTVSLKSVEDRVRAEERIWFLEKEINKLGGGTNERTHPTVQSSQNVNPGS